MPSCLKWHKERHQECARQEDQGYNECAASRQEMKDSCCDWAPCSWFCDIIVRIISVICVAWTWISNWVCVAWNTITTATCIAWDTVVTAIDAAVVSIESVIGWGLSGIAVNIEVILGIPVIGSWIRWAHNIFTHVIMTAISIPDAVGWLIGVRPEKKLRVCPVILRDTDGEPVATMDTAVRLLQTACDVFKRDANVRLIPSRPFKYTSGFSDGETADASWVTVDGGRVPTNVLVMNCGPSGVLSDFLDAGTELNARIITNCFYGAWRRIVGYGAPVTCFFIRTVEGNDSGCSFMIPDYVVIEGGRTGTVPSNRVLAHEVGHACYLQHVCVDDDPKNLMAKQGSCSPPSATPADTNNPQLSNPQVLTMRLSKHCTYL